MIKVIREGRKLEDTPIKGECIYCGCVVECFHGDTTWVRDGPVGGTYGVRCPNCGGWIYPREIKQ